MESSRVLFYQSKDFYQQQLPHSTLQLINVYLTLYTMSREGPEVSKLLADMYSVFSWRLWNIFHSPTMGGECQRHVEKKSGLHLKSTVLSHCDSDCVFWYINALHLKLSFISIYYHNSFSFGKGNLQLHKIFSINVFKIINLLLSSQIKGVLQIFYFKSYNYDKFCIWHKT